MAHLWHGIPPGADPPEDLNVVIEIPSGSKCKYELEAYPSRQAPRQTRDWDHGRRSRESMAKTSPRSLAQQVRTPSSSPNRSSVQLSSVRSP